MSSFCTDMRFMVADESWTETIGGFQGPTPDPWV